jgi:5'-phosphate synthase pdxT subunit
MKKIGILAVQGAFIEHEKMISDLGYSVVELRQKSDIKSLDGLVLPGGESTVQGKLLNDLDMLAPLKELISSNIPVLGTCAGLILLAQKISNDPNVYFGSLPVTVKRNAYGRQLGSFNCHSVFGAHRDVDMTFIRAPFIESASDDVEILSVVDEKIVAARYKNQIGISFHPELGADTIVHEYFLSFVS